MNGKKLAVGAAIVGLLALGGGVAIAAQQQGPEPKVDRAAAEEAALSAVPGVVEETELEREGGSSVYEVEIAGKRRRTRRSRMRTAGTRRPGGSADRTPAPWARPAPRPG